ncbi:unnamed protein product [Lactuca virosa]|uniref:Reverse transcriptase zinc-binding domain-containing protein n=1 Tax=Lactuca virosa TaxID=75947 RepID=A0AAU9MB66_9ASTR|nr:unnamed protein product [Lactuca virosa]
MLRFGRLFSLATNQDAWVSEFWSSVGWKFHWRRGIRGGVESTQFDDLVELLSPIRLGVLPDKCIWDLDPSGIFSVSSTRNWVDVMRLPLGSFPTRWNRFVPIKINIFLWRVILDRMSVRVKLVERGWS